MAIRRRRYALGAAIVLAVEEAIALFVKDRLIPPLVGGALGRRPLRTVAPCGMPFSLDRLAALLAICLLQGCSPPQDSAEEALMDRIEQQVRLPSGARPLAEYARYYAASDDGKVRGTYLIEPELPSGPGIGCSEMTEDGGLKDLPCPPMPETLGAGQRRWLRSIEDMPGVSDGGCSVIEISFDRQTSRLNYVRCNGEA